MILSSSPPPHHAEELNLTVQVVKYIFMIEQTTIYGSLAVGTALHIIMWLM